MTNSNAITLFSNLDIDQKKTKLNMLLKYFEWYGEIFSELHQIIWSTNNDKRLVSIYSAFIETITEVKSWSKSKEVEALDTLQDFIISIKEKEKKERQEENVESILQNL